MDQVHNYGVFNSLSLCVLTYCYYFNSQLFCTKRLTKIKMSCIVASKHPLCWPNLIISMVYVCKGYGSSFHFQLAVQESYNPLLVHSGLHEGLSALTTRRGNLSRTSGHTSRTFQPPVQVFITRLCFDNMYSHSISIVVKVPLKCIGRAIMLPRAALLKLSLPIM